LSFFCTVAAAFPSGQYLLKTRLEEIRATVESGATEIDIVIDRSLVLTHQWEKLYQEIQQMKEASGPKAHVKTILAVGELGSLTNVYKAALVAMMAGSDFIKTSTGLFCLRKYSECMIVFVYENMSAWCQQSLFSH
jgi:deoxyribose-phosphate aldolase